MNLITHRMKYATIITVTGRKGFCSLLSALEEGHRRTMVLHRPFVSFFSPLNLSFPPPYSSPFALIRVKSLEAALFAAFGAYSTLKEHDWPPRRDIPVRREKPRKEAETFGRKIRKSRRAIPRRRGKSRFHSSTRPISRMPAACVYFVSFYIRIPKRPRFYMSSFSPPVRQSSTASLQLFPRGSSHF